MLTEAGHFSEVFLNIQLFFGELLGTSRDDSEERVHHAVHHHAIPREHDCTACDEWIGKWKFSTDKRVGVACRRSGLPGLQGGCYYETRVLPLDGSGFQFH